MVSDSVFDFNSAYLTAAWNDGLSVTVEGLNRGATLYSKTVVVDTTQPTLMQRFIQLDDAPVKLNVLLNACSSRNAVS
ncbi:MAG: hypothetical protein HWQ41_32980 [Nostoc sp. NOS(2021)]|uniref:hypothetical protein n=1 Tax=Nostoc sp. NOS(2021) TaxID=2815407 RepID=UPI0025E4798C|nr:hypothetical protein [Nostoc sp. NOS(2021)]MBN3899911.1 hypothetical protein [Nostoc sp. NOS(2021)]